MKLNKYSTYFGLKNHIFNIKNKSINNLPFFDTSKTYLRKFIYVLIQVKKT